MHGGKAGPPAGERNGAWRHGFYTREATVRREEARALISDPAAGDLSVAAPPTRPKAVGEQVADGPGARSACRRFWLHVAS